MSVGERIKLARRLAKMTLRDLSSRVGVSYQAISKYERGQSMPGSDVLIRLAEALNVKVEFFFRPTTIDLNQLSFRKRMKLPRREEDAILGEVQEWIERYIEAECLVDTMPVRSPKFSETVNSRIDSTDGAERVADELRFAWQLGLDPIDSVTELLEDKGIRVYLVDGHSDFDACGVWVEEMPIIVSKRDIPGDRQRFNLAHELGHLVLKPSSGVNEEKAANRFAGAFLVPSSTARAELGAFRNRLHLKELHLLKLKYGLSMQAWIDRAQDCRIISHSAATSLYKQFRMNNYHKCEPGSQLPPEVPKRIYRLVLKALAEGMISEMRAAELLKVPLHEILELGQEVSGENGVTDRVRRRQ